MTLPVRIVLGVALVSAIWAEESWRRGPERQVRASIARLEEAFRGHDAAGVFDEIHADYPVPVLWPELFGEREPAVARAEARRLLAALFLQAREQPLTCTVTVRSCTIAEEVVVRGDLAVDGGIFGQAVPLLTGHRFTFRRTSWLTGRYAISGHDPIAVRY